MFKDCKSLPDFNAGSFSSTANVTDMSLMFYGCENLTALNLNTMNTAKVTDMSYMFEDCFKLTSLNLRSFNTANVTNMQNMFFRCNHLKTIYASSKFNTANVRFSNAMFAYDASLTGGRGTKYSSSHADKTYARIDKAGQPGYFTA